MVQELEDRISQIIQEFDFQGCHRTGTVVDGTSAEWLAEWVRSYGLEAALEPFDLDRIDPILSYLEVDGQRIEGLPSFESSYTDAAVIGGRGHRNRFGRHHCLAVHLLFHSSQTDRKLSGVGGHYQWPAP